MIAVQNLARVLPAALVSLLAALVLAAGAAPDAVATYPGRNGVIVYSTTAGELWALASAGGQKQLTQGHQDSDPSFSPSGDELLFQRDVGGTPEIYRLDLAEGDPTLLTAGESPDFAPDGRRFAFTRDGSVYVGSLRGGVPQLTVKGPGYRDPRWSPKGVLAVQRFGSSVGRGGKADEIDALLPGGRLVEIASGGFPRDAWPSWSPDGRRLDVSYCVTRNETQLPSLPRFGRRQLPFSMAIVYSASCGATAFSPDGTTVEIAVATYPLLGVRDSNCPGDVSPGGIAWQPLGATTYVVPATPCESLRVLGSGPPAPEDPGPPYGTEICTIVHHHRRPKRLCAQI